LLHRNTTLVCATIVSCLSSAVVMAQDGGPKVGEQAPDFTLRGSTKVGLLAQPIRLSDLRGQVVVLAFFPKARTKG